MKAFRGYSFLLAKACVKKISVVGILAVLALAPLSPLTKQVSAVGEIMIENCQDLQAINNDLAADYMLANDIDCSGLLTSEIFTEDFEGGIGSWTTDGISSSWNIYEETCTTLEPFESPYTFGSSVLGTYGNAGPTCSSGNTENSYASSPVVSLPASGQIYLKFDSIAMDESGPCYSEDEYDRKTIELVDTDTSDTYVLNDCYPLNNSNPDLGNLDQSTWVFDLSSYAGMDVAFNFLYTTDDDCCEFEAGWFIDNVSVGAGSSFVSLGDTVTPFEGSLDGAGYSISGLSVTQSSGPVGLFGVIATTGSVSDLVLSDGIIDGVNVSAGAVAGENAGTITNVTSDLTVSSASGAGGLVGLNTGDMSYSSSTGLIDGDDTAGGLVGENSGNISYSYATGDVSGVNEVGGFVGANTGNADIVQSFAEGDVGDDSEFGASMGGFVGNNRDSALIQNSYATGSVTGNEAIGGFVGRNLSIISNSYASGTVRAFMSLGGFAGAVSDSDSPAILTNVFTTSSLVLDDPLGEHIGGAVGFEDTAPTFADGIYFDATNADMTHCAESDSYVLTGECVAVNADGTAGDYFFDNNTNAPLDAWDFDTVWFTSDTLPLLQNLSAETDGASSDSDGVDDTTEDAAPNDGDANDDGLADSTQENVASLLSPVNSEYAVLESADCSTITAASLEAESDEDDSMDNLYDYPAGLMSFTLEGCPIGGTETITQYYYGSYALEDVQVRKYDAGSNTYSEVEGAVTSSVTIGGQVAIKVMYQVTDGGALDQDGTADGTIIDPAGVAVLAAGSPNTGLQSASILPTLGLLVVGLGMGVYTRRYDNE